MTSDAPLDRLASEALRRYIRAPREQALVFVAARLGIADLLNGGPRTSAEVAAACGAHPASLHRALRGLAVLGLVDERDDGRFVLAPMGAPLRRDAPGSLRADAILGGAFLAAWANVLETVITGRAAFDAAHGEALFPFLARHPDLAECFDAGMAAMTHEVATAVADAYDFAWAGTVVDVGGGLGGLLAVILTRHAAIRGLLLERPGVATRATERLAAAGLEGRCGVVEGDFFVDIPSGADAYVLQAVIHDWDDARAARLLATCRAAISHAGRLLVVERLLPTRGADAPAVVEADVNMLVLTGGRERTEAEYRGLLRAAGFALERTIPTATAFTVLEATPME
jgi:hypothetical protein